VWCLLLPFKAKVNIGLQHVFSCESDPDKRAYILQAFEEVEHVFSDVKAFGDKHGYCWKCKKHHQITNKDFNIDLHLCGPSCKDLSTSSRINDKYCFEVLIIIIMMFFFEQSCELYLNLVILLCIFAS